MNQLVKKIRLNQNPQNVFELWIEDNSLIFDLIQFDDKYIWISIRNANDEEILHTIYKNRSKKIKFKGQKSGYYYVDILVGDSPYGQYDYAYSGKQIVIYVGWTGEVFFKLAPFALWNVETINSERLCQRYGPYVKLNVDVGPLARKITADCHSVYGKVLAIHDWIADTLSYDYVAFESKDYSEMTSISDILKLRRCVCQGYSDLALAFFDSLGIQAENVCCYAKSDEKSSWADGPNRFADSNHVFNRVKLSNRWLYMDITWDSLNEYRNGVFSEKKKCRHKYFDITVPMLSTTHRLFRKED